MYATIQAIKVLSGAAMTLLLASTPALAAPSLRHRLIFNFEGEAEAIDPDTLIDALIAQTAP